MKMQMFKYAVAGIVLTAALGSCKDMDGDFDSIVPEAYHSIITIKDCGVRDVPMSIADGDYHYPLVVLKGGSHDQAEADVMLEVLDQQWIDDNYNNVQGTRYKVLTASMYSVTDYHVKVKPGESGRTVDIVFDTERIYAAMQRAEEQGMDFVLPVRIESATQAVDEERSLAILQVSVSPVVLSIPDTKVKVRLPDNDSEGTYTFVVEKRGEYETSVRFEPMTPQALEEKYAIPEGVAYRALESDMYVMEKEIAISASTQYYTHSVTFDINKIKEAMSTESDKTFVLPLTMISETPGVLIDNADVLLVCSSHEYTLVEITNKDGWSVVYGSIAMPFGLYANMFDGNDDTNGWMGHINDDFPNSQNIGKPYAVIDLGVRVMLGRLGVQFTSSPDFVDCNPVQVDFYISEDMDVTPGLTATEWDLLNAKGNYGNPDKLSDDYLTLHRRLLEFDQTVDWELAGSVTDIKPSAEFVGVFWVDIPQNVLNRRLNTRYLKLVATPANPSQTTGDRVRIGEIHADRVTAIDNESIN